MPGVVLLADYFKDEAERLASMKGVADLPRMVFNGTFEFVSSDELSRDHRPGRRYRRRQADGPLQGANDRPMTALQSSFFEAETLEEVNRLVMEKGWGDGLPVVPPTEDRVLAMLAHTGDDPAPRHGRDAAAQRRGDGREGRHQRRDGGVQARVLPHRARHGRGGPGAAVQHERRGDDDESVGAGGHDQRAHPARGRGQLRHRLLRPRDAGQRHYRTLAAADYADLGGRHARPGGEGGAQPAGTVYLLLRGG